MRPEQVAIHVQEGGECLIFPLLHLACGSRLCQFARRFAKKINARFAGNENCDFFLPFPLPSRFICYLSKSLTNRALSKKLTLHELSRKRTTSDALFSQNLRFTSYPTRTHPTRAIPQNRLAAHGKSLTLSCFSLLAWFLKDN